MNFLTFSSLIFDLSVLKFAINVLTTLDKSKLNWYGVLNIPAASYTVFPTVHVWNSPQILDQSSCNEC